MNGAAGLWADADAFRFFTLAENVCPRQLNTKIKSLTNSDRIRPLRTELLVDPNAV